MEFGAFDRFDTLADLLEAIYDQLDYFSHIRIKAKLRMAPAQFLQKWESAQQKLQTDIHSVQQVISLPPHPPPAPSERCLRRSTTAFFMSNTCLGKGGIDNTIIVSPKV